MEKKPINNPGLSPKAWDKFHKMLAASNIKYAKEIKEGRIAKAGEKNAAV